MSHGFLKPRGNQKNLNHKQKWEKAPRTLNVLQRKRKMQRKLNITIDQEVRFFISYFISIQSILIFFFFLNEKVIQFKRKMDQ